MADDPQRPDWLPYALIGGGATALLLIGAAVYKATNSRALIEDPQGVNALRSGQVVTLVVFPTGIADALRDGATLRAFRSGGGLRVVRLERANALVGYGEGSTLTEALDAAATSLNGAHQSSPYLTGSSSSESTLDEFVVLGGTLRASYDRGEFVVELSTTSRATTRARSHDLSEAVRQALEKWHYWFEWYD